MHAFFVELWTGQDTINWLGSLEDVPHHSAFCINPPPFGAQCTIHAQNALQACLQLRTCRSLACPDPLPYTTPRLDNIKGPVCQARSASSIDQWRTSSKLLAAHHGMCQPNGCHNFFLFPARISRDEIRSALPDTLFSNKPQSQIVLISERLSDAVWHKWLG